jgi:hypothetical protein
MIDRNGTPRITAVAGLAAASVSVVERDAVLGVPFFRNLICAHDRLDFTMRLDCSA